MEDEIDYIFKAVSTIRNEMATTEQIDKIWEKLNDIVKLLEKLQNQTASG